MGYHKVYFTCGSLSYEIGGANTNCRLKEYQMGAPKAVSTQPASTLDDQTALTWENAADTIELYFYGSSSAAIQTALHNFELVLYEILERRSSGEGDRGYVKLQLSSDTSDLWRSEVLLLQLVPETNFLSEWGTLYMQARLYITRKPWWEGDSESTASVSSNYTGATTSGVRIDNTTGCWVNVPSASISTSMPTPLKIRIDNDNAGAQSFQEIWASINQYKTPASFTPCYTLNFTSGTYSTVSYNFAYTHLFSATQAALLAGRRFQVIIQQSDKPVNMTGYWQASSTAAIDTGSPPLYIPQLYTNEVSSWSEGAGASIALGAVALPPGGYDNDVTTGDYVALSFWVRHASAATSNAYSIKNLYVFPNKYLRYYLAGAMGPSDWAAGEGVVDDPYENHVYYTKSDGKQYDYHFSTGQPLMFMPGRDARVYVHVSGANIENLSPCYAKVRVWYRKRRMFV